MGEAQAAELLPLLHDIHRAAGAHDSWNVVLERLRNLCDAEIAALSTFRFSTGSGSTLWESPVSVGFAAQYSERFCVRNPWFLSSAEFETGRILTGDDLVREDQFERTDFYLHYLRPLGLRHWLCGVLSRTRDRAFYVEFHRGVGEHPFGDADRRRLRPVLAHLRLALRNHWRLRQAHDEIEVLRTLTNRLGNITLVVDRDGTVLHRNEATERNLRRFGGLRLVGRRVESASPIERRALRSAIREVADSGSGNDAPGAVVTLTGRLQGDPLTVGIRYLGSVFLPEAGAAVPVVSLSARCPRTAHDPEACLFARKYSLTPAQSRLSALVYSGYSLADAAHHLRVSENTVRSHLKQIYSKTDTHGQMEMVHLHAKTCVDEV